MGYAFHILKFHTSFIIIYHLLFLHSQQKALPSLTGLMLSHCFLRSKKLNITTDSLSCIQTLCFYVFKSYSSYPIIKIWSLLNKLSDRGFDIKFQWVPGHLGISDDKMSNSLAKSTAKYICLPFYPISWFDLYPILKKSVQFMAQ